MPATIPPPVSPDVLCMLLSLKPCDDEEFEMFCDNGLELDEFGKDGLAASGTESSDDCKKGKYPYMFAS